MLAADIVILRAEVATVIALPPIMAAATIVHPPVEVVHQDPREATRAATVAIPPGKILLTAACYKLFRR